MMRTIPVLTRIILLLIIVMACTLIIPSLHYEFTNWDDDIHVTNNPAVRQLSVESLARLFRPTAKYMYHPLTIATYALDWKTGGNSPWNFHLTNILLHLLNIVLVFFLLRKILSSDIAALFCTAVFALHPLQVESVAWISARKELLYAFFYLGSLLFYFEWDDKKKTRFYILSLFFFFFSLLSKPTAVTLPFVIIMAEFWRSKRLNAKTIYRVIPFLVGASAFALLIVATQNENTIPPLKYYSSPQQALLIVYQVVFYIWKTILPIGLSACYAYPQLVNGALPLEYYMAPPFLVAVVGTIWLMGKKSPNLFLGLLFYVVTLSPVLQIVPFNNASLVADRYIYLPVIGLAFFFYQIVELIESEVSKYSPGINVVKNIPYGLFILGLFVVAFGRIGVWKDSITLFDDVIEKNNHIGIAYGNRANAKIQKGDFGSALADCDRLIEISPGSGKAFYIRGNAHSGLKLYNDAVNDFTQSVNLGYHVSSVYYNRGTAYYHVGIIDSALADYRSSLSLDPTFADPSYSIGYVVLHALKDPVAAIRNFEAALAVKPKYVEALYQKAFAEYDLHNYGNAMHDLAAAISEQPELKNDSLVARINRSIDSVNAEISVIGKQIAKASNPAGYYAQRSKLYLMLGDSVRAALVVRVIAQHSNKRSPQ